MVLAGAVGALIFILLYMLVPEPPVEEMELARSALSDAARVKADIYSRKLFQEAKNDYDSAMANWQRENERFIYLRNYEKVGNYATASAKKARDAAKSSDESQFDLEGTIRIKIENLNKVVGELNKLFTYYPLSPEIRNRISRGKMLLKEAELEYSRGHLLPAERKISDAEFLLSSSHETANSSLRSYFNSYPVWKSWVDKTIALSKTTRDYVIIVDKYSRKLMVYIAGVKKYEYTAELGQNWVGDKRVSGDKTTPEGMYKVIRKLEKSKTKYYKALLLNYPNEEDTARFRAGQADGSIPAGAKIGGLIEIHGSGGRGADWTDGCVALTDREMDIIYRIVKIGTPVTIVGSVNKLEDLLAY